MTRERWVHPTTGAVRQILKFGRGAWGLVDELGREVGGAALARAYKTRANARLKLERDGYRSPRRASCRCRTSCGGRTPRR